MRTLELFAGGGGAALGLKAAGCQAVECLEWNPDAGATLLAAGLSGRECDLSQMTIENWRAWAEEYGRPDLLWGSPPCQAFSIAGRRLGASDDRNGWPWTLRAIDGTRPTWGLFENVTGLLLHLSEHCGDPQFCPGCYWEGVILPKFRDRFASVQVCILNAADYGVPQQRRRLFLVVGPRPIRCPAPTHARPEAVLGLFGSLRPWVTMADVLGAPSGDIGDSTAMDAAYFGSRPEMADRPSLPVLARAFKGRQGGFSRGRSPTGAQDGAWLGGYGKLTVEQCAALQGFPAGHPFQGSSQRPRYMQVGNAVPPALAKVLASAIAAS